MIEKVTYKGKEYNIKYQYERKKDKDGHILSNGGKTTAYIDEMLDSEKKLFAIVAKAEAHCSKKENFSKKLGRKIATGRLKKQIAGY